jgi:hypothetical protein
MNKHVSSVGESGLGTRVLALECGCLAFMMHNE